MYDCRLLLNRNIATKREEIPIIPRAIPTPTPALAPWLSPEAAADVFAGPADEAEVLVVVDEVAEFVVVELVLVATVLGKI